MLVIGGCNGMRVDFSCAEVQWIASASWQTLTLRVELTLEQAKRLQESLTLLLEIEENSDRSLTWLTGEK